MRAMTAMASELTPREAAVCALLTAGQTAKQAAAALGISPYTVVEHKKRIFRKLGVDNIVRLTRAMLMKEMGKGEE